MFNFRIINMPDGNQVIDPSLKTPYSALTAVEMVEYTEMERRLEYMNRMEQKAKKEAKRQQKLARNPIYKMACFCRLV